MDVSAARRRKPAILRICSFQSRRHAKYGRCAREPYPSCAIWGRGCARAYPAPGNEHLVLLAPTNARSPGDGAEPRQ
jgi:hypothetical protein